jgi:hypothetical protein
MRKSGLIALLALSIGAASCAEFKGNKQKCPATPEVMRPRGNNEAPAGFTAIFNGKDLTGWLGRKGDYSPYAEQKLSKAEHDAEQAKWNADMAQHWRVDSEKGEIVNDGHGVFLATNKDYGNFEMYVDWLMVSHNGDSGIYLRDYPQVQIWDPDNKSVEKLGAPKGSGALWNDNDDNPGKWPLVKADKPIGEWNTFHIKMIDNKVWVWFNDQLTVDGQVLDNIYDRKQKILPTGAIELQTHGSEMHFRNIYLKELPATAGK